MFFRSKKQDTEGVDPIAVASGMNELSLLEQAAAASAATEHALPQVQPAEQTRVEANVQDRVRQLAQTSMQAQLAFAQIISLLMKSPAHMHSSLANLEWMVLPGVVRGQYGVLFAKSETSPLPFPVAAALWACVSSDFTSRIREAGTGGMRLSPDDWASGDIPWLILLAGDARFTTQLVRQVVLNNLGGRHLKYLKVSAVGASTIETITAHTQSQPSLVVNGASF